jgi:hypothetical protein
MGNACEKLIINAGPQYPPYKKRPWKDLTDSGRHLSKIEPDPGLALADFLPVAIESIEENRKRREREQVNDHAIADIPVRDPSHLQFLF